MTYFYTKFGGNYGLTTTGSAAPTTSPPRWTTSTTAPGPGRKARHRRRSRCPSPRPTAAWACVVDGGLSRTHHGICTARPARARPADLRCFWTPYQLSTRVTARCVRPTARATAGSTSGIWRTRFRRRATTSAPRARHVTESVAADADPRRLRRRRRHDVRPSRRSTSADVLMFNRVDWGNDIGVAPYTHYRLTSILNGVGGQTLVTYSAPDCPLRRSNPRRASTPSGVSRSSTSRSPGARPDTAGSTSMWPPRSPSATCPRRTHPDEPGPTAMACGSATDTSLWAPRLQRDSVQLAYRTWPQWRGYTDVTTTHGPAGGTQTVSKNLFYRGMHGDSLATGDNQAMVWDSRRALRCPSPWDAAGRGAIGGVGGRCLGDRRRQPRQRHARWSCRTAHGRGGPGVAVQPGHSRFQNPVSGRCLTCTRRATANDGIRGAAAGLQRRRRADVAVHRPTAALTNPISGRCLDAHRLRAPAPAPRSALGLQRQLEPDVAVTRRRQPGQPAGRRCVDVAGSGTADGSQSRLDLQRQHRAAVDLLSRPGRA